MPLYRMLGPNGDVLLSVEQDEVEKMRGYNYREDGILGYVAAHANARYPAFLSAGEPGWQPPFLHHF